MFLGDLPLLKPREKLVQGRPGFGKRPTVSGSGRTWPGTAVGGEVRKRHLASANCRLTPEEDTWKCGSDQFTHSVNPGCLEYQNRGF